MSANTGPSQPDAYAPAPGRRLGEILRERSGAGHTCFIGGEGVAPIYARSDDSVLEGYGTALCMSFAALERRLLVKRARSPRRPQQLVERIEFDDQGRIGVTTAVLLTLEPAPAEVQDIAAAAAPESEPLRLSSTTLEPIDERQAADDGTADYLLVSPETRAQPRVHRVEKRVLSRTEWSYDEQGRVRERRSALLHAVAAGATGA